MDFSRPIPLILNGNIHVIQLLFVRFTIQMNGNGARSKPMIFYDVFRGNTRLITTPHNGQKKTIKLDANVQKRSE